MSLPDTSKLQFTNDLKICRVLTGMWQVSGAHGNINPSSAIASMFSYFDAGFTTFDLADHYGPSEDFIGTFRQKLITTRGKQSVTNLQAFTKWVPRPEKMTKPLVVKNIDISLKRMQVDCLDLLQFHWWDYQDKNYLDALQYLSELQTQGKIKHLGLTNFDTDRLKIIIENKIKIVSNQVQFSVIDLRPQVQMIRFCEQHNIKLLCYGVLGGGLISQKYVDKPEPSRTQLNTASLRKYKNMIDNWGNWSLFQELLQILKKIAIQYNVSLSNVAMRYILEQSSVAGVIIGARLGVSDHLAENSKTFDFSLTKIDQAEIEKVHQKAKDLYRIIGDCGDEYRR